MKKTTSPIDFYPVPKVRLIGNQNTNGESHEKNGINCSMPFWSGSGFKKRDYFFFVFRKKKSN